MIACHWQVVLHVSERVDENLLSFGQTQDDGVVLRGHDGRLLTVDHTCPLIPVLGEDDSHVPVRVDWVRVRYAGAGDVAERASLKQLAHNDGVDALRSFPGHCHYAAVRMTLEGCPDLPVGELSFRAKNNAMLDIVHLLLGRMDEPYEVQKCGVFRIDDTELLV